MSKAVTTARIVLGLIFVVFSANYVLQFMPQPELPEKAGAYLGALAATGFMFPLIKLTEFVGGLLVLVGRGVPLGLTLLAPVIVNIVSFHLFLAPGGLPVGLVALLLELFLAWAYRDAFSGVLDFGARPS